MCGRIPMRPNEDDRYFTDLVQQMPADRYTAMFDGMLDHPGIEIRLHTDYRTISREVSAAQLVWTGPIDAFFGHQLGKLPYRSLRFEYEQRRSPPG